MKQLASSFFLNFFLKITGIRQVGVHDSDCSDTETTLSSSQLSSAFHPKFIIYPFLQTVKFETSVHSCRGQELSVLAKGHSSHQSCMVYNKRGKSKVKNILITNTI